jgi:peptidoglycan hydrolase-like protein with peptidoglycan-binding domain
VRDARGPGIDDVARPRFGQALPQPRPLRQRPSPWPLLRRGSRGPAVGRLQRILNQRLATIAPTRAKLAVDQVFGPLTEQAVLLFQGHAEIQRDGVVGRITWAHLSSDTLLAIPASAGGSGARASGRGAPVQPAAPLVDSSFASSPLGAPAAGPQPQAQNVADWSIEKKFEEVLRRTLPKLPFAMQEEFAKLLTPEAIAVSAAVLAALAIAHLFGVGEAVDIALLLVGVVFLGLAIFDVVSHLVDFLIGAARAETSADLDEAADHLAYAISVMGVAAFLALLRKARTERGLGKRKPAEPDKPRPEPEPRPRPEPEPAPRPRPEPEPQPKPRPKQAPPGHTQPTGEIGGKPTGRRTKVGPQDDPATRRSLQRENESADVLADHGYKVEQRPNVPGGKKPDYEIEGEIFDCKAPSTGNPRSAATAMKDAMERGQADRFVLNLEDSTLTPEAMKKQLSDWPIDGLKEVLAIKNGQVVPIWP